MEVRRCLDVDIVVFKVVFQVGKKGLKLNLSVVRDMVVFVANCKEKRKKYIRKVDSTLFKMLSCE